MSEQEFKRYRLSGPLFDEGFSLIPNAVLRERRLSGLAKATWALLYDYSHRHVQPELAELAADLGVGVKLARKAIADLEEAGSVRRTRHGLGLPNSYSLLEQPPFQKGSTGPSGEAAGEDPTRARQSGEDLNQDGEVEGKPSTSRRGTVSRRRDVVYDALVEATAANPADGGMIGKAIKSIRAAETDRVRDLSERFLAENPSYDGVPQERIDGWLAAQIQHRAAEYRRLRPEWELTPTALAKHWNRIATWKAKDGGSKMTAADIAQLEES